MRWRGGSLSVSASSTHARSLDLRFVALVGVAAVGTLDGSGGSRSVSASSSALASANFDTG